MAQHKAPTAVSIAPVVEKPLISQLIERYWMLAAAAAVCVAAVILFRIYTRGQEIAKHDESWTKLMAVVQRMPTAAEGEGLAELRAVADQVQGQHAAPWALYLAASKALEGERLDEALELLGRLRQENPSHMLATEEFNLEEGRTGSLLSQLEARIAARKAWNQKHPYLFANLPPAPDAPRVKLNTDRGSITVALYEDLAPKHAENFLKLCREGFYNGVKFHRIGKDFMIQAGDPNSIEGEPSTWGLGGPGWKIEREENRLRHFKGVLAAAKGAGETQSSGSQFYITVADRHDLDEQYVVFGQVVEGLDLADELSQGAIAEGATDRPAEPATIQSTEVL